MNKVQFWILNIVGVLCGGLILTNLYLGYRNVKSERSLQKTRQQVALAQEQVAFGREQQTKLQNLAVRVAQLGLNESSLSNLLVRHDMRVNLNPAALPANPPVSPAGLTNPATPVKPTP
jgi:hypothetical protein